MTYQHDLDESSSVDPRVRQVLTLLSEALGIIDELADVPAIGARLSEVIEKMKELQLQQASAHSAAEVEELSF